MIRETVFLNGGQLKANQCERAIKTDTKTVSNTAPLICRINKSNGTASGTVSENM